jgi:multidrug resistance efflux pump
MAETKDPLWLRYCGRLLGLAILIGAAGIGYHVTRINYLYPRTDDAAVRANIVGIAPHVSGALVQLNVVDNQEVNEGDLLFVIDSQPHEATLARFQADLLLARSELEAMSNSIDSAVSEVKARQAELELAAADLRRYVPLLKDQAIEAETVDTARTRQRTAQAQLLEAQQTLKQQQNLLGQHGTLNARISAAEADVRAAQINVDYCRVRAPFKARVTNLNTSAGQFARTGEPLFALVDTRRWYVVANFRETFLQSIKPGLAVDVFLMAYPQRPFHGRVQGVGWAVQGRDESPEGVLADIKPTLNWVRLAQRIPVRIDIEDPDPQRPYRMGMTAIVTIRPAAAMNPAPVRSGP